jgi:hypothetical protein
MNKIEKKELKSKKWYKKYELFQTEKLKIIDDEKSIMTMLELTFIQSLKEIIISYIAENIKNKLKELTIDSVWRDKHNISPERVYVTQSYLCKNKKCTYKIRCSACGYTYCTKDFYFCPKNSEHSEYDR